MTELHDSTHSVDLLHAQVINSNMYVSNSGMTLTWSCASTPKVGVNFRMTQFKSVPTLFSWN